MIEKRPPLFRAIELDDLSAVRDFLDAGADIHQEYRGFTPLHLSIEGEIDAHAQSGEPLHVDTTAYLLARGADPRRRSEGGKGVSAEQMAFQGPALVGYVLD